MISIPLITFRLCVLTRSELDPSESQPEVRDVAKVAAITSTVVETTYTVTSTSTLVVPAHTATQTGKTEED
jgi:hypothetical protein